MSERKEGNYGRRLYRSGKVEEVKRVGDHYVIAVSWGNCVEYFSSHRPFQVGRRVSIYCSLDGKYVWVEPGA